MTSATPPALSHSAPKTPNPGDKQKPKAFSTSASKMGPVQAPLGLPDFNLEADPVAHTTSAAVKNGARSATISGRNDLEALMLQMGQTQVKTSSIFDK